MHIEFFIDLFHCLNLINLAAALLRDVMSVFFKYPRIVPMRDALKRSERGDYRSGRSCGGSSLVAVAAATCQDYQRSAQIEKSSHVIINAIPLSA